jgi:hypothetical protein
MTSTNLLILCPFLAIRRSYWRTRNVANSQYTQNVRKRDGRIGYQIHWWDFRHWRDSSRTELTLLIGLIWSIVQPNPRFPLQALCYMQLEIATCEMNCCANWKEFPFWWESGIQQTIVMNCEHPIRAEWFTDFTKSAPNWIIFITGNGVICLLPPSLISRRQFGYAQGAELGLF